MFFVRTLIVTNKYCHYAAMDTFSAKSTHLSPQFVSQVRRCVLENATESELCTFDPKDVQRLRSGNDWFVRRFLVNTAHTSVETAVKRLRATLLWRCQFGVNQLHDHQFPAEFFAFGGMFVYLEDREGNTTMIVRCRLNARHPKLPFNSKGKEMSRKFFIHTLEKALNRNVGRKVSLIVDFQHASLAHADFSMAHFLVNTLLNHYYDAMAWGCFLEMPWILNKLWLVIRAGLSEDARRRVHFCTRHSILQLVDRRNLPDFMGGTARLNYRLVPPDTPSMER